MNGFAEINGHLLEFTIYHGQGGGWDEMVVWCRTCEPYGQKVMRVDVERRDDIAQAFIELMEQVKEHCFK